MGHLPIDITAVDDGSGTVSYVTASGHRFALPDGICPAAPDGTTFRLNPDEIDRDAIDERHGPAMRRALLNEIIGATAE